MNAHSSPKDAIFKMFLCFPSATKLDEATAAMMTAAYMDTVREFSSDVVSEACDRMRRRSEPFPPTAGELFEACGDVLHQRREVQRRRDEPVMVAMPRLPRPPAPVWSEGHLADWTLVINAPGLPYVSRAIGDAPMKIPVGYPGEGRETFYGYLTPREAAEAQMTREMREVVR